MLRIICLAEMYPNSVNVFTGPFVHRQNRALKEKGVEIKVIAPLPWVPFPLSLKKKWGRLNQVSSREELDGIEVYHPRRLVIPKRFGFHFNVYSYYGAVRRLVTEFSKNFEFDLFHAHVAVPDGLAGVFLAREMHKPLVVTVHGKDTANAEWSTVRLSQRCKECVSRALERASKVVAVSSYVKRSILEACPNVEGSRIAIIPGGVDVSREPCMVKGEVQPKTILSVGALIPLKGHHYTIEAMKKVVKVLPDCRLIIVGEGAERKNLTDQAEKAGLRNVVNFLDLLPQPELFSLMATCDLFVLPSWAEGLGLVYLEAMALGLPVIGCRGQGIQDIVSHGETGLLATPEDSGELADLILSMLGNEPLRQRIGKKGKEFVLRNCRWEENAAKHIELYENLIRQESRQGSICVG